jgi:hypothetical protein
MNNKKDIVAIGSNQVATKSNKQSQSEQVFARPTNKCRPSHQPFNQINPTVTKQITINDLFRAVL